MKRQKNNSVNRRKIVRRNTQSSASTYVGETLPIDLIIEILLRLPAKSIQVFGCVSKQWSSLLRRPDFTESFLTSSLSRPRLLFTIRVGSKWRFFSSPQPRNFGEKSVVATEYHMGYSSVLYDAFVQSVHGFIYLEPSKFNEKIDTFPVICNPCTGQHITLPKLGEENSVLRSYFGYDPIGKQFKVLCRTGTNSKEHYQVLTLGNRELSWRKIECSFLHNSVTIIKGISINGVLYYISWTGILESHTLIIVCFDVRSEKFSFIEIGKLYPLTLINYKGKLGVVLCVSYVSSLAELWVLDDANKVKWSKHTIFLPVFALDAIESIWANDTGEIAWASSPKTHPLCVFYYNMERQSVRRVEIEGMEEKVLMGEDHGQSFYTFTNHVENLMFL